MSDLGTALDLLAQLVAIPSVSDQSNGPVVNLIEAYLTAQGVPSTRVPYLPGKENLLARIGPADVPPLILSGHTDVVPVAGQNWTSDPFHLTERDGAYFGRGTADMKGFLALCLSLVPRWVAGDLARPVLLVFSCDEEIGCRGVLPAIDRIVSDFPAPLGAIIGEPTSLEVITREKGNVTLETEIIGAAAHSAAPSDGSNAIIGAAHVIKGLAELASELARETDNGFTPDHTTLNIGTIDGGTQKNIVPDRCVIRWEIRPIPGPSRDKALAWADALADRVTSDLADAQPGLKIRTRVVNEVPSLAARGQDPILPLVLLAAGRNTTSSVSFASEAGHFQRFGCPAVLCGPGRIDVAHKADEHITRRELLDGLAFLETLTCGDR